MSRGNLRCAACRYFPCVTDAQLAKPEGACCPSCLAPVGVTVPVAGDWILSRRGIWRLARTPALLLWGTSDRTIPADLG